MLCVHPQHVSWKTQKENEADKAVHGTAMRGERHHQAKLGEADVGLIRLLLARGMPKKRVARGLGVSPHLVYLIAKGRNWRHAPLIILVPDQWVRNFLEFRPLPHGTASEVHSSFGKEEAT